MYETDNIVYETVLTVYETDRTVYGVLGRHVVHVPDATAHGTDTVELRRSSRPALGRSREERADAGAGPRRRAGAREIACTRGL
jgi:hypothetical protein